jgi:hypothetical protein
MYFKFKENGKVAVASATLPEENSQEYTWVDPSLGINIKRCTNGQIKKLSQVELDEIDEEMRIAIFKDAVKSHARSLLSRTDYLIQNDIWFSLSEEEQREIADKRKKLREIEFHPDFPRIDFSRYE